MTIYTFIINLNVICAITTFKQTDNPTRLSPINLDLRVTQLVIYPQPEVTTMTHENMINTIMVSAQVALVTSFETIDDLKGYTRVTLKILVTKQVADSHF